MNEREVVLRDLYRGRDRRGVTRWSAAILLAIAIVSWLALSPSPAELWSERRQANFARFVEEMKPYPLQGRAWDWAVAARWSAEIAREKAIPGAARTLAISIVAILLAGAGGAVASVFASRDFAGRASRARDTTVFAVRAFLVFIRSIPEYVWAFLFVGILGPGAWPAVLALAAHNAGILGKLDAEVIENLPREPLLALSGLGAPRPHVALFGVMPAVGPRVLLFLFYRWETCVREATVLGMLGIVSLGWFIQDARARMLTDEMVFLVLTGALIVMAGDALSSLARALTRNA